MVVVVVIVSMGLLVTVLAVGIVRLRAETDQGDDPELELGWEGGDGGGEGPNITVNPLEVRIETNQLSVTQMTRS